MIVSDWYFIAFICFVLGFAFGAAVSQWINKP